MANLKTGVSRKQSTPNFPKNEHFLPPYTEKFDVLCFLETPVLRFALLPYYRRNITSYLNNNCTKSTGHLLKSNFLQWNFAKAYNYNNKNSFNC